MSKATEDRYLIVSTDGHAGLLPEKYRDYVDPRHRDAESIANARNEIADRGLEVDGMEVDVTRAESVNALAERVFASYGNVHLLFNNAGVGIKEAKRRIWTLPEEDWQWTYVDMKALAQSAGVEFKLTEPKEGADMAIEGIRNDRFWILSKLGKSDERLRTRTRSILKRKNPEPTQ